MLKLDMIPPFLIEWRQATMEGAIFVDEPAVTQLVEIGVSYRYAQMHGWVINAVSGWLSAYYMEEPRFRISRRDHELETGMHLWVCEVEGDRPIKRMLKRLQADLPPFHIREQSVTAERRIRYVIDLSEAGTDGA